MEENETDDESDNSMDELNTTDDNLHDLVNSNDEVEDADSDKEAQIDEVDSDEPDTDENDSYNEIEVDEANSDESDNSVVVLNGTNDNLHDAVNSDSENEDADSDKEADHNEDDSDDELETDKTNSDDKAQSNEAADSEEEVKNEGGEADKIENDVKFTVTIEGVIEKFKIEEIFKDCNIRFVQRWPNNSLKNSYCVGFEDQESLTKALQQDKLEINGSLITVEENIGVVVFGLEATAKILQIFQDCNIREFDLKKNPFTNQYNGTAFVVFKDKESQERALEKNQKVFNGCIITVLPVRLKTDLSVIVTGLRPHLKLPFVFKHCNISKVKLHRHPSSNQKTGVAYITFEDKKSVTRALRKDGRRYGGSIVTVEQNVQVQIKSEFTAFVKNVSDNTKLKDIFKDCKIHHLRTFGDHGFVHFEDEKTLQKALLKHKTKHDGRVITVDRVDCTVIVKNLNVDSKLQDVFKNCNIQWFHLITDKRTNKYSGTAYINFKDTKSLEKALSKNKTKFECRIIEVELFHGRKRIKSENEAFPKPIKNSYNPESKIALLKKKILLEELKNETRKLEREIYEESK